MLILSTYNITNHLPTWELVIIKLFTTMYVQVYLLSVSLLLNVVALHSSSTIESERLKEYLSLSSMVLYGGHF